MISFIKGKVASYGVDYVIVENHGIGYRVGFNRPDRIALHQDITLYTYLHVREDELSLYGFLEELDLAIFMQLLGVKGLGPRTCLNILSRMSGQRILDAIENSDVDQLKTLPGIGARTAAQMVLDLRGKLVAPSGSKVPSSSAVNDAVDALKALGFKQSELHPLQRELEKLSSDDVQYLIKQGLQWLQNSKGGH